MTFLVSPGVYAVDPPDNFLFPDDMTYGEVNLRKWLSHVNWELDYIKDKPMHKDKIPRLMKEKTEAEEKLKKYEKL